MERDLRFITKNQYKASEFQKLFNGSGYSIIPTPLSIDEIQTEDMEALVTDKVIKAFSQVRRPVFVDHTGLYFDLLNGLPGGLTEIFWNRMENVSIAKLIGKSANPQVTAVTLISYCDGRSIQTFRGTLRGTIAAEPRGPEGFQWDPIFVPEGHDRTFAELGPIKNEISMRRQAIDKFIAYLNGG